jgi:hypothetical protein
VWGSENTDSLDVRCFEPCRRFNGLGTPMLLDCYGAGYFP